MKSNVKSLVMTALLTALTCAATMSIRIPTPGTSGYIHPGDALVILSGVILGPANGFIAAGIGSALADLLGGYFFYVPITLIIKGLSALLAAIVYHRVSTKGRHQYPGIILGGIINLSLVAGGYFICESFFYGIGAAAASIPSNLIQGIGGLIIALLLYPILTAVPDIRRMIATAYH